MPLQGVSICKDFVAQKTASYRPEGRMKPSMRLHLLIMLPYLARLAASLPSISQPQSSCVNGLKATCSNSVISSTDIEGRYCVCCGKYCNPSCERRVPGQGFDKGLSNATVAPEHQDCEDPKHVEPDCSPDGPSGGHRC